MEQLMRTAADRVRHTILFEILLILIVGPLLSIVLDQPMHTMGLMTISLSLIAMTVNYGYNLAFDHALKRLGKPIHQRSKRLRALHAILFELCLLFVSMPIIMHALGYSFTEALMLDIGFAISVPIYAFFFNLGYDRAFPITAPK